MITTLMATMLFQDSFRKDFNVPIQRFKTTGSARYFVLEPGYTLNYQGKEDGGTTDLKIVVLDKTKTVDGVETRIIEEKETHDGKLVEISRNFFAIDSQTSDVYYFGEEVDIYKNGKIVNHGGAWLSGKDGAHYGMFVAGHQTVGDKYYQELAANKAMDQVTNASVSEVVKTPAGTFKNCLKLKETTPLEKGLVEYKLFAPGIGLIVDNHVKLTSYSRRKMKN